MPDIMNHVLVTIRDKRDALLRRGHVYLYTFEDFDQGISGHPVDVNVYPALVHAISIGHDPSWHVACVNRGVNPASASRPIHGRLLGPTKPINSESNKRGYDINWRHAREVVNQAGGSKYTIAYAQYHAFDHGMGICVVYGRARANYDLTVDVFTVEESYYEAPKHSRLNTESTR